MSLRRCRAKSISSPQPSSSKLAGSGIGPTSVTASMVNPAPEPTMSSGSPIRVWKNSVTLSQVDEFGQVQDPTTARKYVRSSRSPGPSLAEYAPLNSSIV